MSPIVKISGSIDLETIAPHHLSSGHLKPMWRPSPSDDKVKRKPWKRTDAPATRFMRRLSNKNIHGRVMSAGGRRSSR